MKFLNTQQRTQKLTKFFFERDRFLKTLFKLFFKCVHAISVLIGF